jgi:hypothetical protein
MGFQVGVVTNGYWSTEVEDALEWLWPLAGLAQDLSVSSDLYHWSEELSRQADTARRAPEKLNTPAGVISVAQPEAADSVSPSAQLPLSESGVIHRGRAAGKLVEQASLRPWKQFAQCPYENLREPRRLHLDPLGNLHICQGISLGNVFRTPLSQICEKHDADAHPITSPLLAGGPAELVRRYGLAHREGCADACHLYYQARRGLRGRFPDILLPDRMYGVVSQS